MRYPNNSHFQKQCLGLFLDLLPISYSSAQSSSNWQAARLAFVIDSKLHIQGPQTHESLGSFSHGLRLRGVSPWEDNTETLITSLPDPAAFRPSPGPTRSGRAARRPRPISRRSSRSRSTGDHRTLGTSEGRLIWDSQML